jgi:hypothetical protein
MKAKIILLVLASLAILGCTNDEISLPENTENVGVEGISSTASTSKISSAITSLKTLPRPTTWVDCELFAGVVTPATFKPEAGKFDELYAGGNGFKDGSPLISESKPGDQDYNGGRWHLNVLKGKEHVDPAKYQKACSVEQLDLNDFTSTDQYFECPLLPRRGGN